MDYENIWAILFGIVVGLIIWYWIIAGAVSTGMRKTNERLDKQNRILTRMLSQQGVDKHEINELLHSQDDKFLHKLMGQKDK